MSESPDNDTISIAGTLLRAPSPIPPFSDGGSPSDSFVDDGHSGSGESFKVLCVSSAQMSTL